MKESIYTKQANKVPVTPRDIGKLYESKQFNQKKKLLLLFSLKCLVALVILMIKKKINGYSDFKHFIYLTIGAVMSVCHLTILYFRKSFYESYFAKLGSFHFMSIAWVLIETTRENMEELRCFGSFTCGLLISFIFFYSCLVRIPWGYDVFNCAAINFLLFWRVNYPLRNLWGLNLELSAIFLFFFLSVAYFTNKINIHSFNDFTNIQQAKNKLKWHKRLIKEQIPCQIIVVNMNLDKILFINKAAQEMFHFQDAKNILEEFKKIDLWAQEEDSQIGLQTASLFEYLLKGKDRKRENFKSFQAVGRVSVLSSSLVGKKSRLEIKIGKIDHVFGEEKAWIIILNDLTVFDRIAELRNDREKKDQMLATVSHDLRTPINSIMNILAIVLEGLECHQEKLKKYVKLSINSANSLLFLVNDLLDIAQLEKGKLKFLNLERQDIKDLIEPIFELLRFPAKKKGIEFNLMFSNNTENISVLVDRNRFQQIIINLIGNALKFTDKLGRVTIKIATTELAEAAYALISVEDTGMGIKAEDIPRLFTAFGKYENKVNKSGVGLGLSISQKLAKMMVPELADPVAGISVVSEYGKGSCFSFPVKLVGIEDSAKVNEEILEKDQVKESLLRKYIFSPNREKNPELKKLILPRILIVDDDQMNLFILRKMIKKIGPLEFETAVDGMEAIAKIEQSSTKGIYFDLVFMDKHMPNLDGLETSKLLKERILQGLIPALTIYILSADLSMDSSFQLSNLGVKKFLKKPLSFADFSTIINSFSEK